LFEVVKFYKKFLRQKETIRAKEKILEEHTNKKDIQLAHLKKRLSAPQHKKQICINNKHFPN